LGAVLSRRGNYPDAEKAYEASLALAPDYAPALSGLAEILVKQGRAKQASARIGLRVAAQPGSYQLQVAKAEFCIAQKAWPCAERSYQEALALNPYYVNGYLALAPVYAATDRPSKVIQEHETARSKFPDYPPTYVLLAQVYEYVGDVNRAQQTYERALTVDPNFYLAQTNLARLYADHGGPLDEALKLAQRAKVAQPDDPNVNDALGWIYYKDGLYRSAVPVLEAAVAKSPQVGKFQFHLGMLRKLARLCAEAPTPCPACTSRRKHNTVARELHSRPGTLAKKPRHTDRLFCEGSPVLYCVALPSAISKVNAIIPRVRTWECGFVLFTQ
jgi:tetratricopeptide (TPR) repeat protein